ncbi:MAG TPA: TetR family transcriptional regulator [Acidimicrobiales bacterium]
MPRPELHTAKGQRRRNALIVAAAEVVAERGYAGVTHRAVAARAEVPVATITYYFSSIDELVLAGVSHNQLAVADEIDRRISEHLTEGHTAQESCRWLAEVLLSIPQFDLLVNFEVYLNGTRQESLHENVTTTLGRFTDVARRVLEVLGADHPDDAAPALLAMVEGFLLHHLCRPAPDDLAQLQRALESQLLLALMSDEERALAGERLMARVAPASGVVTR